jgi:hypothetical protein
MNARIGNTMFINRNNLIIPAVLVGMGLSFALGRYLGTESKSKPIDIINAKMALCLEAKVVVVETDGKVICHFHEPVARGLVPKTPQKMEM